ncbi:ATP-dependent helicase HrpA [Achromatium sp. WMS2]|nr:ATP-dependent helicase HrpA [Achromatium sp. WMS2]
MDSATNQPRLPKRKDLDTCLLKDRPKLWRYIRSIKSQSQKKQDYTENIVKLQQEIAKSKSIVELRLANARQLEIPDFLPISAKQQELADLITKHQVIILCGETGSGKSTQLPKICLNAGRGILGRIGHTQPRRIAARSLATRIAQELESTLGTTVGYKVRFQDHVHPETQIKLMTDGILLAEIQHDKNLYEYDTLILDEAHERSLNIDFLIGYLKQLLPKRPELKVIITSATIDPQSFAAHFDNAPIVEVSGKTYPVTVRYRPLTDEGLGELEEPVQQAICQAVTELSQDGRGDILIFLSGEREIRETAATLRKQNLAATEILPLYARLGNKEQARIFAPHAVRHIVLATNVAETSLTVPGIKYVIDLGLARISRYSPRSKVQRLPIERIAQAAAEQRKGRCGRLAPGICIRLYSEDSFNARRPFTEPEIQRTNLAAVILQMQALGFGDIAAFPFLEPPDLRLINDGYRLLWELQAINQDNKITPLGHQLARLPTDPRIGRMLLAAAKNNCLAEVSIIAAALSIQDPRDRPLDNQEAADQIHATFNHNESDFLTLVNLWQFLEREQKNNSKTKQRSLCQQHFLSWARLLEWQDTRKQFLELMHELGISGLSRHKPRKQKTSSVESPQIAVISYKANLQDKDAISVYNLIHQSILAGLLGNVGLRDIEQGYQGVRGDKFWIHPGSGQFRNNHKWIMVAERVQTTKDYGRVVAKIMPGWIEKIAEHLVERSYSEPHWLVQRGYVGAFEQVSFQGLVIVAKRRINYGPINPAVARAVFIRSALVDADFVTRAPFFRHNQELKAEIESLEAKARRRDLLLEGETIEAFYTARIPSEINNGPDFEKWLQVATKTNPRYLHMEMRDLLPPNAELVTADQFPNQLVINDISLQLSYNFEPGTEQDGVTLTVPLALINQIAPTDWNWLVPGLLEPLTIALIRGLPKEWRKLLIPIADTVAIVLQHLELGTGSLIQALSTNLLALKGIQIPESLWNLDALPNHLRLGFRIVDSNGATIAWSRNFGELQTKYGSQGRQEFAAIGDSSIERDDIKRWDFGELPATVSLKRGITRIIGYPALVDRSDHVALRIMDSAAVAAATNRIGLCKLALLAMPVEARRLRNRLQKLEFIRLCYAKVPVSKIYDHEPDLDLEVELINLIVERALFAECATPCTEADFKAIVAAGRGRLETIADEIWPSVETLLKRYQRLRLELGNITQINWQASISDMQQQLDGLIYKGFLRHVSAERLQQYPRYISALETRLERLPGAALRDQRRLQILAPALTTWQTRWDQARAANNIIWYERLMEMRWMLEELRISLFAQPQPTAYPISMQRLQRRWRELGF